MRIQNNVSLSSPKFCAVRVSFDNTTMATYPGYREFISDAIKNGKIKSALCDRVQVGYFLTRKGSKEEQKILDFIAKFEPGLAVSEYANIAKKHIADWHKYVSGKSV